MKTKLLTLFLLYTITGNSQVKIDSLGFHLGSDGYYVIDDPESISKDIQSRAKKFITDNTGSRENTLLEENDGYIKFRSHDDFMVYLRRHGSDGFIGQNTIVE